MENKKIVLENCGLYGDYEVTIKQKYLNDKERKNAEVELPPHFKLIIIPDDISVKVDRD